MYEFWIDLLFFRKWYYLLFHFVFWDYVAIATAKAIQIVVPHLESPKYKFLLNISNLIFILFLFNLE